MKKRTTWLLPLIAALVATSWLRAEDVYLQVEGDWKKTDSGRQLEKTFGFATGAATYGLSYDIEVPADAPPGKATSSQWVFTTGYIPLGMPGPSNANWYVQGYFTVRLDGHPIHDVPAEFRTVRSGGDDALVEGSWPTAKGPVAIRLAMRGGDDKLLMQVELAPETKVEKWELELRCYPHAFTEPRDRWIATAESETQASNSVDLDREKEPWVLYYDKLMDGDPAKGGPCGLVYVPEEVATAKVTVGSYPITTRLSAKPGSRRITVGLWDFTPMNDVALHRNYLRESGSMIAADVAAVAAHDWTAGVLPAARLPETRVRLLAERVQDRRRSTPYDEMTAEIVTPHIAWARPLAGGPVRTLVVGQRWHQRETVELAQRLAMEHETVCFSEADSVLSERSLYLYGSYGAYGYPRKNQIDVLADLSTKLRADRDCLIFSGFKPELIPENLRSRIVEKVRGGAGLILLGTATKLLDEFGKDVSKIDWSPGVVRAEQLPVLDAIAAENRPIWTAYAAGKGRILVFHYPTASRSALHGLTPLLSVQDPDNLAFYDYYHSLFAAGVLWAARREMPVRVQVSQQGDEVSFESADPVPGASLEIIADDGLRAVRQRTEEKLDLPRGTSRHKLAELGPAAGAQFVSVLIKKEGRTLGWNTARRERQSDVPRILAVELPEEAIPRGNPVTGKVRLSSLPAEPRVTLELRDTLGRILARQQSVPSAAELSFSIPLRQPIRPLAELRVRLDGGDRWLDQRLQYLGTTWQDDGDYHFLAWSDGSNRAVRHFINQVLSLGGVDWIDNTGLTGGDAATAEIYCRNAARQGLWSIPYITRIHSDQKTDRVRRPCLTDPKHLESWTAGLRDRALGSSRYGVPGYTLGDENYLVRANSVSVCTSPTCLAEFREMLEKRYGTLDELNGRWQTEYRAWDEVIPATLEDVKENPKLWPRWALHRLFMDGVFTRAHAKGREAIRSVDPDARVGFDGVFDLNSWHGYDFYQLCRHCDLNQVYAVRPPQIEYLRSWHRPGAILGSWYNHTGNRDETAAKWLAWHLLFHGLNSSWYWTSYNTGPAMLFPDLRPTPQFHWMRDSIGEIRSGIGKLLLGARRLDDGIAIHYSQASVHAGTLLGRRPGDAQWAFAQLVEDLGYQHRMLSYEEIEQGKLEDYRVLLMPACTALSRKEAEAIRGFVQQGGLVIADTLPGILEDDGYLPRAGLLDDLFGVSRSGLPKQEGAKPIRFQLDGKEIESGLTVYDTALMAAAAKPAAAEGSPAVFVHGAGKGTAVLLNTAIEQYRSLRQKGEGEPERRTVGGFLEGVGLKPQVAISPEGPWETVRFADGDTLYVAILPDDKFIGEQSRSVRIGMPHKAFVYDVRDKKPLGETDAVAATLVPGQPKIYALMPYNVQGIEVRTPREARAGTDLPVEVAFASSVPPQARHCVRIELVDPQAAPVRHYAKRFVRRRRNPRRHSCRAERLPGPWTLRATDIASGRTAGDNFSLSSRSLPPSGTLHAADADFTLGERQIRIFRISARLLGSSRADGNREGMRLSAVGPACRADLARCGMLISSTVRSETLSHTSPILWAA